MRTATFCFWRVPDDRKPGRTHITRWKMTREDALARWPTAVESHGHELRNLPETEAEQAAWTAGNSTSAFIRGGGPPVSPDLRAAWEREQAREPAAVDQLLAASHTSPTSSTNP